MHKACSVDLTLFGFRDDIWFDDVDLEDIENATGKKVEVASVMDKSIPLPQVSEDDKKIKEVRYCMIYVFNFLLKFLLKISRSIISF